MTNKRTWQGFKPSQPYRDYSILFVLWLIAAGVDRLWFQLDQAPPAWDQGDHLARAMHYWRVLQHPHLFSGEWWIELWEQSPTYRAPLVYLLTVPCLALFGAGYDQAALVNLIFTGVIIIAIYHLGKQVFSPQVGCWAAGLCLLPHTLAYSRTDYLLDYGLTASITAAFTCLTLWRYATRQTWPWTIASGLALGAVVLNRPTGLLFLGVPLLWLGGSTLWQRQWKRVGQLAIAGLIGLALAWPWFSTNWLTIISSIAQANAGGLVYEGDPQANTLAGWLHYARELPAMFSLPIVWVGIGCGGVELGRWLWRSQAVGERSSPQAVTQAAGGRWTWLLGFVLGIYALCSLAANKDPRFIQPYLPVVGLLFARLLTLGMGRVWVGLRWGTVSLAIALLLGNLFPLKGFAIGQHRPYLGSPYPHAEVITEVIQQQPYLRSTIGLVTNTAQINPMNVDFYGAMAQFQVYGRQLAFSDATALQDSRVLDWYLTKTGDQGAYHTIEAGQQALKSLVESSPDLKLRRTWPLPDASELRLYHRRTPPVTVSPSDRNQDRVRLLQVELPSAIPPGQLTPVTYTWSGPWAALRDGLVLMDWVPQFSDTSDASSAWLHDHGLGMGQLYAGATPPQDSAPMEVVERLAMQPPAGLQPGAYTVRVTYLNRKTGESYPLTVPTMAVGIDPQALPQPAPELDLPSLFRGLAVLLPQGNLDPIFNQIGRINQYDPIQDYLAQVEMMVKQRLKTDRDRVDLLYVLALVDVLERQAADAIATLTQIADLAPDNPYNWSYLGFVRLYAWQPRRAQAALDRAETLNPDLPNLKLLQGVAAIQQFNLVRAWRYLH